VNVVAASFPGEPFIDKFQAAVRLGVTTRTIDLWTKEHDFPYQQVVGRRRYLWSEILAWIERRGGGGERS
jgi:predicted DNA-binding transcriptional regulator AlpA